MAQDYPEWQRLQEILELITARGFSGLTADEIIEFGKLYRRASTELSFQRMRGIDLPRLTFLNGLVGKCYAHVYVAPHRPWPSASRFFAADFPRAFRRHAVWMLLAVLVMLIPALIAFVLTWHDRVIAEQVLPPELMSMLDRLVARHHTPQDWLKALQRAPAASIIMTNNIRITFLAFAGGMTGGVLTLFLLIFNGVMLGIIGAGVALDGPATTLNFWAFVAPHGVIELSAIYMAGAAGLLLGYAIINPGGLPRRIALRNAGKEALLLIMGVAALLVVAGLIEGFFSPLNIHEEIKLTVALVEFLLLYGYLFFAGRHAAEASEPPLGRLLTPV